MKINRIFIFFFIFALLVSCKSPVSEEDEKTENKIPDVYGKTTIYKYWQQSNGKIIGVLLTVNLTWEAMAGATQYKVYKSTKTTDQGTLISNDIFTKTQFLDTLSCANGTTTYYYWVSAVGENFETERPASGGVKVTCTCIVNGNSINTKITTNPEKL